MMSSRTALAMLMETGEPMMVNADETVAAHCITMAQMRKWFISHGFRADGERCAMSRWLAGWLESGQLVKWDRVDSVGWWFTEVPAATAYRVVTFAESFTPYATSAYKRDGTTNVDMCRDLGISVGALI